MKIFLKYLVTIREKTGIKEEIIELDQGAMLQDIIDQLNTKYNLGLPDPSIMGILNGKGWTQLAEGTNTKLNDGDKIALFPPISGG